MPQVTSGLGKKTGDPTIILPERQRLLSVNAHESESFLIVDQGPMPAESSLNLAGAVDQPRFEGPYLGAGKPREGFNLIFMQAIIFLCRYINKDNPS